MGKFKPSVIAFIVIALSLFGVANVNAVPQITEVTLGTAVNTGYYCAVLDTDADGDGVWINAGQTSGNSTTDPGPPASSAGFTATPARMYGMGTGYGQLLLSIDAGANFATEMASMFSNQPQNANTDMFGSANGPCNKTNIELNRALPAGTQVTFTIDMDSEVPHLVAVMGAGLPTVTYNPSGTGTLTVQATTFGTTTYYNDTFTSIIGLSVMTDQTAFGATPMKIIAQTNHWVGDIFPLLPGYDDSAAVANNGGTYGQSDAKCGITIYGQTGGSRSVNVFLPDAIITNMFGSGVSASDLTGYVDAGEASSPTVSTGQSNFGTTGTVATFSYTFASPKDASIGVEPTGIIDDAEFIPSKHILLSNYPNPFNAATVLSYNLPHESNVTVEVFNLAGQKVVTLVEGVQQAGEHSVSWDASTAPSGVYFARMESDAGTDNIKMVLLK
ncbi:MAG: T9SS type A sorting domain-containing protein [candidate division Zixibacteria bacterium]|nr:T9SS type A sorting domain-containing protein [candidate division Zixibacteria bacterium]